MLNPREISGVNHSASRVYWLSEIELKIQAKMSLISAGFDAAVSRSRSPRRQMCSLSPEKTTLQLTDIQNEEKQACQTNNFKN